MNPPTSPPLPTRVHTSPSPLRVLSPGQLPECRPVGTVTALCSVTRGGTVEHQSKVPSDIVWFGSSLKCKQRCGCCAVFINCLLTNASKSCFHLLSRSYCSSKYIDRLSPSLSAYHTIYTQYIHLHISYMTYIKLCRHQ